MTRVRPWDMPPPGLELDGFMETQETVRARMVARLGTYRPEGLEAAPLARLVGKGDDPAVMLLDAWAVALDVLYFYQRRLLPEGFVDTATMDRSIHEMAAAVAVDVQPARSAAVTLCFTVSEKQPGPVEVPARTGVQSVPGSGGGFQRAPSRTDVTPPLTLPLAPPPAGSDTMPQVFETSVALTARAEWNEMKLAGAPDPAGGGVSGDATGLLARGGSHGVGPGDALILIAPATGGGKGLAAVRTVRRIGRARARGCTLFLWSPDAPLQPGVETIAGLQAFTCRAPEPLFGNDAPDWSDLPLAQRAQYRAMVGGLARYDEATQRFVNVEQPAPAGHPAEGRVPLGAILCLYAAPGGVLLAGAAEGGLSRRTGEAAPWAPVAGIAAKADVLCVTRDASGRLYAGTSRGVFRSADQGLSWEPMVGGGVSPASTPPPQYAFYRLPATPVRALAVLAGEGGAAVIAGTDDGILRWDPVARVWPTMNQGLPASARDGAGAAAGSPASSIEVRALAVDPKGTVVYAGTNRGIFVHPADGLGAQPWKACDGASGFDVSALGVDAGGVVYAGLAARGGLAVRGTDGTWTRLGGAFADVTVRGIVVAGDTPDPAVLVGTDRGVLRSTDGGRSFQLLGPDGEGAEHAAVTALAVAPEGAVLVATPFVGVADAQGKDEGWPSWALERGKIDLARVTTRVAPGDRVALVQDTVDEGLVLEVLGVSTSDRDRFGRRRRVTTLLVSDADLSAFDRRRARVCVAASEVPLFDRQVRDLAAIASPDTTLDQHLASETDFAELTRGKAVVTPADPRTLDLEGVIPDLTGRPVMVVGKPLRVRAAVALDLVSEGPHAKIVPGEVLDVLATPGAPEAGGTFRLRNRLGVEGDVEAPAAGLTLLPAAADAADVPQLRKVASCLATSLPRGLPLPGPLPVTRLTLDEPLDGLLDPATVTVLGNVVDATHGRTVLPDKELLGISDGSANLRFTLRNKPLTWMDVGEELTPALEVWVQKHLWTRVEAFADEGPDSLVYVVRGGSDGASIVCFGDGVRGRRPPAESEIVADYRYGAGVVGNVAAGRITMIRQRPLGLKAVVNPLAAAGGADAEPADDLRDRAPVAIRALDRIVSLRDFEDVAATSPGIARAAATVLTKGRRSVLFVTVATDDETNGYQIDPGSTAYQDLLSRLPAGHAVEIGSAAVTSFDVSVTLALSADAAADDVASRAREALLSGFGFEQRGIRQGVAASDVVACLADLDGVSGVRVDRLETASGRRADGAVLAARDAAWDAATGRIEPAEILLVNEAEGGVTIKVEGAR